jgi:hypothetical protein
VSKQWCLLPLLACVNGTLVVRKKGGVLLVSVYGVDVWFRVKIFSLIVL